MDHRGGSLSYTIQNQKNRYNTWVEKQTRYADEKEKQEMVDKHRQY